jgi:Tfp pilus assembly protein PilF
MQGRKNTLVGLIVIINLLQGCSAMPQLVRHRDPLSAEEHLRLGASYESQGFMGDAAQQYQAALHLQKNNMPALVARGNLASETGDWKTAEACYRRILHLDPTNAGADNNLAMIYLLSGKPLKDAEQFALAALKQGGPLKPYVLDTLATIYIQQNRYSEARAALDDAVKVAPPDNKNLLEQLADTRSKLPLR